MNHTVKRADNDQNRKDRQNRPRDMFGVIFNVALALVSAGALAYGLVTRQEALTALGAFALGGWAARLRWGPRS